MRKDPYAAGELDQRVTFRKEVKTSDGMGGNSTTWQDIATVWAKVRPMSGSEREHADRQNAEANYLMIVRPRTDIDESCVAVWNDIEFNVRFVRFEPRSRFMVVEVERGVEI